MSNAPLFTAPDAWSGGSYEVALEYGPLAPEAIRAVVARIWAHPALEGCWLSHDVEPDRQPRVDPSDSKVEPDGWLRGVATFPNGERAPCGTYVVHDESGAWVYFGVPLGSLGRGYPVGAFPFDDGSSLGWREEVDRWLLGVAEHVFAERPFALALVGWTDDPETSAAEVARAGVPERRWTGIAVPTPEGLAWHPPTEGAPIRLT